MFSRSAQVFAALTLLELAVLALAATQVSVLLLILVVAVSSVLGLVLFFRQSTGLIRHSMEDLAGAAQGVTGQTQVLNKGLERTLGDRAMKVAGAALLAFPGLLTGLFGGLLMLPPVRSAIRPVIGSRLSRRVPAEFSAPLADFDRLFRRRDVVDVDVVDVTAVKKDPGGSSANPSAPPELH